MTRTVWILAALALLTGAGSSAAEGGGARAGASASFERLIIDELSWGGGSTLYLRPTGQSWIRRVAPGKTWETNTETRWSLILDPATVAELQRLIADHRLAELRPDPRIAFAMTSVTLVLPGGKTVALIGRADPRTPEGRAVEPGLREQRRQLQEGEWERPWREDDATPEPTIPPPPVGPGPRRGHGPDLPRRVTPGSPKVPPPDPGGDVAYNDADDAAFLAFVDAIRRLEARLVRGRSPAHTGAWESGWKPDGFRSFERLVVSNLDPQGALPEATYLRLFWNQTISPTISPKA